MIYNAAYQVVYYRCKSPTEVGRQLLTLPEPFSRFGKLGAVRKVKSIVLEVLSLCLYSKTQYLLHIPHCDSLWGIYNLLLIYGRYVYPN